MNKKSRYACRSERTKEPTNEWNEILIINKFNGNSTELDSHIYSTYKHYEIQGNKNATQRDTPRDTQRDTYKEYIFRK